MTSWQHLAKSGRALLDLQVRAIQPPSSSVHLDLWESIATSIETGKIGLNQAHRICGQRGGGYLMAEGNGSSQPTAHGRWEQTTTSSSLLKPVHAAEGRRTATPPAFLPATLILPSISPQQTKLRLFAFFASKKPGFRQ